MNKYGFDEAAWEVAKLQARTTCIKVARARGNIAYSDLVQHIRSIHIHHEDPRLAHLLGELSEAEHKEGRGMLTVVVTHKEGDQLPGGGFFELARQLGRDTSDREKCWVTEINRVYGEWAEKKQEPSGDSHAD